MDDPHTSPTQSTSRIAIEQLIRQAFQNERAGDIAGALRLARQALAIAQMENLLVEHALALTAVARYRFRLGQYSSARQMALDALAMSDPSIESQVDTHIEALLLLGMCAAETSSLVECEQHYRQAADLAREVGNKLLLMRALHNLGSAVYLFTGKFDLAIAADSQSLQICRENGFSEWAIFPLISLAIAYQLIGEKERTRQTLADLRAQAQSGSGGEGYACYVTGMLALDEEDFSLAETQFKRALAIAEEIGDPSLGLDTRLGVSRLHRLQGEYAKAIAWAEDALVLAQRFGYRIYQGRGSLEHGRAAHLNGNIPAAMKDFAQAEIVFVEMDLRCDLAELFMLQAAIAADSDDPRAPELFLRAVEAVQDGGFAFVINRERALTYSLIAGFINDDRQAYKEAVMKLLDRLQASEPKPVRAILLGKLEVWLGGRLLEPRQLRQRRAGEMLSLLIASPENSLTWHQVAEAMCPEKDPEAALDFYYHATSALRRLLEPDLPDRRFPCRYLEVTEERVSLHLPRDSTIDYWEFEAAVRQGDWQKAVELYRGEFLPGLRFSEWTIATRHHLADQYETALLALAEGSLRDGHPQTCQELVRKVLLNNSWQEKAVVLGMRAALLRDDRATAIKMYRALEKNLRQELGIQPQDELQELFLQIKRDRPRK